MLAAPVPARHAAHALLPGDGPTASPRTAYSTFDPPGDLGPAATSEAAGGPWAVPVVPPGLRPPVVVGFGGAVAVGDAEVRVRRGDGPGAVRLSVDRPAAAAPAEPPAAPAAAPAAVRIWEEDGRVLARVQREEGEEEGVGPADLLLYRDGAGDFFAVASAGGPAEAPGGVDASRIGLAEVHAHLETARAAAERFAEAERLVGRLSELVWDGFEAVRAVGLLRDAGGAVAALDRTGRRTADAAAGTGG